MRRKDLIFIALCFLGVAAKYAYSIYSYSSDLFILDAWHPVSLVLDTSLLEAFFSFNGPHPLGLTSLFYALDPYSASTHAWIQFLIIGFSALLALILKYQLSNELRYYDAAIPILFFVLNSLESTLSSPYIHGLLGIYLLSFAVIYLSKLKDSFKLLILALIAFFSVFSLYFYIPLIFFSLLLYFNWKILRYRWYHLILCMLCLIAVLIIISMVDSTSSGLISMFNLNLFTAYLHEYLLSFWNLDSTQHNYTISVFFFSSLILSIILLFDKRKSPRLMVLAFFLLSFFAFAILQALGRHNLSLANAHASRYSSFMPILMFTIYLIFRQRLRISNLLGFLFLLSSLLIYRNSLASERWASDNAFRKQKFIECLNGSIDLKKCQNSSDLIIHPMPEREGVKEQLLKFKESRKGIFK